MALNVWRRFALSLSLATCCAAEQCDINPAIDFSAVFFSPDHLVDVVVVQRHIDTDNPLVKIFTNSLYHTAMVLQQIGINHSYTVKFDAIANEKILGGYTGAAMMPQAVSGHHFLWNTTTAFIVTEGIDCGREAWTKTFDTVAKLTADQAKQLISEFLVPYNALPDNAKAHYQPWRVMSKHTRTKLASDVKCDQGVGAILNYVAKELHVPLREGFDWRYSTAVLNVDRLELVSFHDPSEWSLLETYYQDVYDIGVKMRLYASFVSQDSKTQENAQVAALFDLLMDAYKVFVPLRYIYVPVADVYYKLVGTSPWAMSEFRFDSMPIEPLPSQLVALRGKDAANEVSDLNFGRIDRHLRQHDIQDPREGWLGTPRRQTFLSRSS